MTEPWPWMAALLLVLLLALWGLSRLRRRLTEPEPDTDVVVTLSVAPWLKLADDRLDAACFARIALCHPNVSDAVARGGLSVEAIAEQLAERAGGVEIRASSEEATDYTLGGELEHALGHAAGDAKTRGDPQYTLLDVLRALVEIGGPTGGFLGQLGLDLEEDLFAAAIDPEPSGAFVYVWNDAVSPMDTVARVFREVFGREPLAAIYLTLTVHHQGYAALGPFPEPEAAAVIERANTRASELEIPLAVRHTAPDISEWRPQPRGLLP